MTTENTPVGADAAMVIGSLVSTGNSAFRREEERLGSGHTPIATGARYLRRIPTQRAGSAHWRHATALASPALRTALGTEALLPSKRTLALIGFALLACYAAFLELTGLTASIAPMVAITLSAGVSSIAGFAFSAVAQASLAPLMHDPIRLVQILLVCSIVTQSFAIVSLWRHMDWKGLPVYLAGGVLGLPIGVYLLLHLGLSGFHTAIGALLIVYGTYVLLKRPITLKRATWPAEVAVGFLGGITGGLAAFPGAAITVWCSMRGWDKARQRGVYQPFILTMQLLALATIALMHPGTGAATAGSPAIPYHALAFIPGTLLGTWFGLRIFHKITDRTFGKCLAALLALSGVLMIV